MEIMVQLLVGEGGGRLVEWVIESEGAHICKMLLQDVFSSIEMDQRIMDRHCEVTRCVVLPEVHFELSGQDLVELGVQYCDGAGFCAGQFLLQRDGVFELSSFL